MTPPPLPTPLPTPAPRAPAAPAGQVGQGAPRAPAAPKTDEELCLLGTDSLRDFIDFVRERAVDGRDMDPGDLADLWRDAAQAYKALETAEPGAADKPAILPLPPRIEAHVKQLAKLAHFKQAFAAVPVAFGMVELDKLITCQFHITRSSIEQMEKTLPATLDDEALAQLCLPLGPPPADFRLALDDGERFVFTSDNHDPRFLGAKLVKPADIKGFAVNGHAQAVLALAVGFTTNVLNVVRYGNRMVLNNGYHRAMALRARGVTHAPCLIQVCGHWEDVSLAGASRIYENGPAYFSAVRPPLLRDFDNGDLTATFETRRLRKQIKLTFEVESYQLAD